MTSENDQRAVNNFQNYLKIKSVHPNPDYDGCISWIKAQGQELGLEFNQAQFGSGQGKDKKFAVWLTWPGRDPKLKSILLNSHMDVVPVDLTQWAHDPFSAYRDPETGNIYARGTQDMKSVGVQYFEAIRNLKAIGFVPLRNIHVSFVPDEEVGGNKGMIPFVESEQFKKLNVGFGLDEGVASPDDHFFVFNGERAFWQLKFTAAGQTGHGSILHDNTAAEKIHKVIDKMLTLRTTEKERFEAMGQDIASNLGNVTTINMTMISGGLQANVVPPELSVVFDVRITPHWDLMEFKKSLDDLCIEAGPDVKYEFLTRFDGTKPTSIGTDNPWWLEFQRTSNDLGIQLKTVICGGATDARFLRQVGIPALGFSPMNQTPILLHDHNEFLNDKVFLRGIKIYEMFISRLANLVIETNPTNRLKSCIL